MGSNISLFYLFLAFGNTKMFMMVRKTILRILFFVSVLYIGSLHVSGRNESIPKKNYPSGIQSGDSLRWSVDFLNKLLHSCGEWYLSDNNFKKPVQGVLNYAENDPLDTVVVNLKKLLNDTNVVYLMERHPQDIRNIKDVAGYITEQEIEKGVDALRKSIFDSLNNSNIVVPNVILEAGLARAPYVPDGDPVKLLGKQKELPGEFITNLNNKITAIQFPPNMTGLAMDSTLYQLFINYRKAFNDSIINRWRDKLIFSYRTNYIAEQSDLKVRGYRKWVSERNDSMLAAYNDKTTGSVNDSLRIALQYLTSHAEADSALIRLTNLTNEKTELWTANRPVKPIRMFLKNAQNDSLSVVLINNGKGELRLVIDDGVKLTRFVESQNRTVTFVTKAPDKKLQRVNLKKIVVPPWKLIGNGTVGFTQTALSNWSKGGESAMALLIMSKYNANYSKEKVKWESSAEFRYGISQTKARGFEKNDDKIEFQSRFGISAFKKWYYSGESNFRTQIANGYRYPDMDHPISSFMAPGYLTMSLGLDYKPNKDFSLFLSPFTSKTTYVKDTVMIAPSKFGLEPGKKKLWEPGIIVKANWHHIVMENITYDTKVEFFNNYRYTFQKFAFEWEQVLIMRVNRFINARVITNVLYDYNTKFPILDDAGKEIGRKPKWQFKELFTIGFSYRF
jgi:hypothetical protein